MDRPRPIIKALTPALLTQLVNAILGTLMAFKIVTLDAVQMGAIATLLTVIGLVLTTVGILGAETQVTPVEDPKLPEGTQVTVETPKGEENRITTL